MANTFLQFMLRELELDVRRKISDFVVGLVPKPVRKIVGLILLIVGAVALLRVYPGMLFFELTDLMFMITISVCILSFGLGMTLLRHKGI